MRKKVFLVDTENIGSYDFIENYSFKEDDEIVFFVSENSKKISLKELIRLDNCKAKRKMENVVVGTKDALDFQLVVYMTREVEHNESDIYIISEDKGFKAAIEYLKGFQDAKITLVSSEQIISDGAKSSKKVICESEIGNDIKDVVLEVVKEKDAVDKFFKTISQAPKSRRLSYVHNELISSLGGVEGRRLYQVVRPKLKTFYSELDKVNDEI